MYRNNADKNWFCIAYIITTADNLVLGEILFAERIVEFTEKLLEERPLYIYCYKYR